MFRRRTLHPLPVLLTALALPLQALLLVASASAQGSSSSDDPAADSADAPDRVLVGTWEGSIEPDGLDLFVRLTVDAEGDGPIATLDVPLQGATGLPVDAIEVGDDGSVRFRAPTLPGSPVFRGAIDGGAIEGTFSQGRTEVPFELARLGELPVVATPPGWPGTWRGELAPDRAPLPLALTITDAEGAMTAELSLPGQDLEGLEARPVSGVAGGVTFSVPALPEDASLGLRLEDGRLVGTFQQEGVRFPITLVRDGDDASSDVDAERPQTPRPPFPYDRSEVTFDGDQGELAGTLALPSTDGPHPVVVMLNGSGAQDRDGTVSGHATFAVLADHLARAGIGSLRWDDRGVGGSEGDLADAGTDGLVADAAAAVRFLAGRDDVDATRIALLGHSEGGLVAPRVAVEEPSVAALVLLAAPAVPGLDLLELQNRVILREQGAGDDEIDRQVAYLRALAGTLDAEDDEEARRLTRARIDEQLAALPEGQAPSGAALDRLVEGQVEAAVSATFRDFLLSEPRATLARLQLPTLALYARQDVQVPAVQNEGAMRSALRSAGIEDATVTTLAGLNHLFQPARAGGVDEYGSIRTTLAPELLDQVASWLQERLLE